MSKNDNAIKHSRPERAPPGLLMVADFMERLPARADDLLAYEIHRRERELVLAQETKNLLSWHPWHAIRFLILSGALVFAMAWLFSILLELLKLYNATVGSMLGLPFAGEGFLNLGVHLPEQLPSLLSKLPEFGALESLYIALGVVAALALVKALFILVNWKKIKLLGYAEKEFQEELAVLTEWKKDLKRKSGTNSAP